MVGWNGDEMAEGGTLAHGDGANISLALPC